MPNLATVRTVNAGGRQSGELDAAEFKRRAAAISLRAGERAAQVERDRIVAAETIREMHEAELLRVLQPRSWGGFEIDIPDWLDIIVELSKNCGSTGWVYSVLSSHATAIACFPPEAQAEIWSEDPLAVASSAVSPTAVATPSNGGYLVSGKWGFSSGCDFAGWALAGARVTVPEGTAPQLIFNLIRLSDLTVVDDWHVVGLQGTGSKSLIAQDVFVPLHRTLPFKMLLDGRAPGGAGHQQSYFRCPRHAWAPSGLAAVGVGIALGVVDKFSAYVSGRRVLNGSSMADLDTIQLKIAESAAEAETAHRILKLNAAEALSQVEATGALGLDIRARNRRDQAFATRLSLNAVDRLYTAAGAHALYDDNPLQRSFRDMHAVAGQIVLNFDAAAKSFARIKLGRDPDDLLL